MIAFLVWWVIIQIFALAALPLARRIFAWLPDQGYAFAKTTGLLLVSYLLWFGASIGILTNTTGGILLTLLLIAGLSLWVSRGSLAAGLRSFWPGQQSFWREHKSQVLVVELLFLLTFAGWALVRAYAPEKILPAGGEKFMEIALLNGVLNSPRFPPLDPWMAGYAVSYYYFGYVMMSVMARLSGVAATISFDLYDALTFALTAVGAYGVVSNMVAAAGGKRSASAGFGLLASLLVTGMGNLEGLLEGLYSARLLPPAFWNWIDIPDLVGSAQNGAFYPGHGWWWWRASRVLHDLDLSGSPALYQPIDEFPFFSFLLGDNHPHKLALPFVLLVVGLAFNLLLRQKLPADRKASFSTQSIDASVPGFAGQRWGDWLRARRGTFGFYLFYAVALGSLIFLNTWDFPTCLGLVLLAYAGGQVLTGEPLRPHILVKVTALGAALGVSSMLLYIFFFFSFASQAAGVLPYAYLPTRLPQYLVMFGPFIFILTCFVIGAARRENAGRFPWRAAGQAWGWITGLSFGALLALLLAAMAVISSSGLESSAYIQTWLGGLSLKEGLIRALHGRISDPWLYLLLSFLLAGIAAAVLPRRARSQPDLEIRGLPSWLERQENGQLQAPHPTGTTPDRAATLFALLVAFAGLALTLVVEFVYLRDNFGMRMNTIFKLYYQGWVMMACASAYGVWWVTCFSSRLARAVFSAGATVLVAAGLVYPLMGIISRVEGFANPPNLDAAATFAGANFPGEFAHHWAAQREDWAAIQWLNQNGRLPDGSAPRILEAGSGGYENAGRISAFTGFPTLLGWTNHEGQWRGNSTEITRRTPVIQTIFTTSSAATALDLLQQWDVRYLVIGDAERNYVIELCQDENQNCNANQALEKFRQILTPVFTQGETIVYSVPAAPAP